MPVVSAFTGAQSDEDKLRAVLDALFTISADSTSQAAAVDSFPVLLNKFWKATAEAIAAGGGGSGSGRKATTTVAYSASVTPDISTTGTLVVGALTGNLTVNNPTGTPADHQILVICLQQDGTGGRSVTWGADFQFPDAITSADISTVASKNSTVLWEWYSAKSKWVCHGLVTF